MTETCSSAIYFRKLIPAVRIDATMIPDNMRLLEETPPLDEDRYSTNKSVIAAPVNAKSGTEKDPIKLKFIKSATEAPNAAPAETPRV